MGKRGKEPKFDHQACAQAWLDEEVTYQELGDRYGVSREMIRLVLVKELGHLIMALHHRRLKARRRMRRLALMPVQLPKICLVCGTEYGRAVELPTWPLCQTHGTPGLRGAILLLVNEARHVQHSRLVRESMGRAIPTYDGPTWTKRAHRRWTVPGSKMDHLVQEAIANDWPLLSRLPVDLLDRYRTGPPPTECNDNSQKESTHA